MKFCVILVTLLCHHVLPITIQRSSKGDTFDNTEVTDGRTRCDTKKASCVDAKCERCKCGSHETYFKNLCYPDLSHSALECGFAIEDSQYYGLETLLLHNHTFFGYVVRDKDSDSRTFTKCTVQSPSQYWNSRKWAELFTTEEMMKVGGRRLDNFAFVKDGDGLAMTFSGNALQYTGMLLKMQLECEADAKWEKMRSCLLVSIAGTREYVTSTNITSTTASTTTHTTLSTTTIIKTTTTRANTTNAYSTTLTTKTTRQTRITTTPKRIPRPKENSADNVEMKIAISLLIVLIVLLMVVLLWCCCCCRHGCCYSKGKSKYYSEGDTLITPTSSYSSINEKTDIRSTVSSVFSDVRYPNYADIDELFGNENNGHNGTDKVVLDSRKKGTATNSETLSRPLSRTLSGPYESEDHTDYPHLVGSEMSSIRK